MIVSLLLIGVCLLSFSGASDNDQVDYGMMMAEMRALRHELENKMEQETETLRAQLCQKDEAMMSVTQQLEETKAKMEQELHQRDEAMREQLHQRDEAMMTITQQLEETNAKMEQLHQRDEAMTRQFEELKADMNHTNKRFNPLVAFTAVSHDNFVAGSVDTNVPFPVVETNIGGGWSSVTNVFQAPVSGTYLFAASTASDGGNWSRASIVHTDQYTMRRVVSMMTTSQGVDGDANMVILELDVNDYVSVQIHGGDGGKLLSLPDQIFVTFSGILLWSDE